ncbi:MAG TPA: thioredoxin family protein [Flavisolibacter sp.]|nr:thioredoxin family protein [Flavisolibacter sp.]
MKKIVSIAAFIFFAQALWAQAPEISRDAYGTKIIKGFMSRQDLANDTAFTWFAKNMEGYTPEQNAVTAFKANKDSVNIIAFGGTWCGDTKNLLPKFYSLMDASGFPQDRITLLGVDRSKKTIQHLTEAFGITNVPTFIIMKNGREIGRVVEYGKYGMFDKELGEILTKNK